MIKLEMSSAAIKLLHEVVKSPEEKLKMNLIGIEEWQLTIEANLCFTLMSKNLL